MSIFQYQCNLFLIKNYIHQHRLVILQMGFALKQLKHKDKSSIFRRPTDLDELGF